MRSEDENKMRMGLVVGYLGAEEYERCDEILHTMLEESKKSKDSNQIFEVLAMLGYSAHLQLDHQTAIEYLLKAIRMGGQW